MKKILLFMLPIMALSLASCEKNKGNNDELSGDDVIEFKDPNFLKALLTVQSIRKYDERIDYLVDVDANKDGAITVNEAQEVKALRLSYVDSSNFKVSFNVVEMPEIKYFTALTYLDCAGNLLISLDVSNNAALTYLDCAENGLSSLDLSNNTALTYLNCYGNQLTSLDLSKNRALWYFGPVLVWFTNGNIISDMDISTACPLESLMLYKYHQLSASSMEILETVYPELEITYAE